MHDVKLCTLDLHKRQSSLSYIKLFFFLWVEEWDLGWTYLQTVGFILKLENKLENRN